MEESKIPNYSLERESPLIARAPVTRAENSTPDEVPPGFMVHENDFWMYVMETGSGASETNDGNNLFILIL